LNAAIGVDLNTGERRTLFRRQLSFDGRRDRRVVDVLPLISELSDL
jgi:hypothetical protein